MKMFRCGYCAKSYPVRGIAITHKGVKFCSDECIKNANERAKQLSALPRGYVR